MKEKFKRFFASIAAIILALGMMGANAIPAMANGNINNTTDKTYNAYQIFSGTQATNSTQLGSIAWGTGFDSTGFITALKADTTLATDFNDITTSSSAQDVAKVIEGYNNDSEKAKIVANLAQKHIGSATPTAIAANTNVSLANGYYVLIDTSTRPNPDTGAVVPALLLVTNGTMQDITKKYTVPTPTKTIEGVTAPSGDNVEAGGTTNGSVLSETTPEKDSATVQIGDIVTFQLKATLPSNLDDYDTYKFEFHDTLSKGLNFQSISSVTIDGENATQNTSGSDVAGQYILTTGTYSSTAGQNIVIAWSDIKKDSHAANSKDVIVTYTAKVTADAVTGNVGNTNEVTLTYSNNPNGEGEGTSTPSEVKVYTFNLDVTKHDDSTPAEAVAGAGFVLKNNNKYYKYNSTDNVVTWVDEDQADEFISGDDGKLYPKKTSDGTADTDAGVASFKGLAAGAYTLHEKTVPDGYTTAEDVEFTITATPKTGTAEGTRDNTITLTKNNEKISMSNEGNFSTDVINKKGSTLPSTGGIGTTIFYVIGGVVVAGAVILLLARRRKNA